MSVLTLVAAGGGEGSGTEGTECTEESVSICSLGGCNGVV